MRSGGTLLLFLYLCFIFSIVPSWAQVRYATQTTWQATTTNSLWVFLHREKLLDASANSILKGIDKTAVEGILGTPQSVLESADKAIWTYGLYLYDFYHVTFNREGVVEDTTKSRYRRYLRKELAWSNSLEIPDSNPQMALGAWKTMMGEGFRTRDKTQVAVVAARVLKLDDTTARVESLFGKPDSVYDQSTQVLWTYCLGGSTFLQLAFLDKAFQGACILYYNYQNGRRNLIPLCGTRDDHQPIDADVACWLATCLRYNFGIERAGIGIRMSYHIKKGMTKAAVLALLGESADKSSAFSYDTFNTSGFVINFDQKELVSDVRLIGSVLKTDPEL